MSAPASTAPRGIRNNNPGNIRWGDAWQGLIDPSQRTDPSFCQFTEPVYGIRAMARIFAKYSDAYGLTTVRGIIGRWAPPSENNTDAYVQNVANLIGVGPDDKINVHDTRTMDTLIKAVIQHENGQQPYDTATIDKGVALAGV
jgi:hypothetical protein